MIYRLHITCPAGHTTYEDYKTLIAAIYNFIKYRDKSDWYATHIEKILYEYWEKKNGIWELIKVKK